MKCLFFQKYGNSMFFVLYGLTYSIVDRNAMQLQRYIS